MNDLRQALRQIRQAPLLAASVILVLAIAIGANTAILSALQSLVLRQVPWPGADRTLVVWEGNRAHGIEREGVSGHTYLDWRDRNRSFEHLALVEVGTGTITGVGEPRQLPGLRVSANFLQMLGARPFLGRLFAPRDGETKAFQPILVLTHDAWKARFGADPDIIGKTLTIDLHPVTVIGVLDPSFWSPVACEALLVWPDAVLRNQRRDERHFAVFGRLRPGVSPSQAQDELNAISAGQNDPLMKGWSANATYLRDVLSEGLRPSLWALLGAAALVLLSGCANIANLLLARALARRQEVSLRMALGANRVRLARQFLTESALLGLLGGLAGLFVGDALLSAASRYLPSTIGLRSGGGEVILRPIELSLPVLLLSLAVALFTAFLFGMAPLWEALRTDLRSSLNEANRGSTSRGGRLRPALLAFQIAFTLVLLGGASLLTRNFFHLQQADLGFSRHSILTLSIELPTDTRYRDAARVRQFYQETLRLVREVPGVESAGYTSVLPLTPDQDHAQFRLEDQPALAAAGTHAANSRSVTPGYFETLRIRLLQGRPVSAQDLNGRPPVVWIDETLRQRHFPRRNPIGRSLLLGERKFEIAGVVANSRQDALRHAALPTLYFSHPQMPTFRMDLAVRTASDPLRMLPAVKRAIWTHDRDIPVYRVSTMQQWFDASTRNSRLVLLLTGIFALASLALAAVGTYGVVAYQAGMRTREFGIRLALGARPAQIAALMLRQTLLIAGLGALLGVGACFLALRPLESLLYDLAPVDPLSLALTVALLLAVALLAALRPALRATRGDATQQLRSQ